MVDRRRRARRRRPDRRGRHRPVRARRRRRGRRHRRHRDARHDRHAPAHVADGDAGLRRRLDPHPVLRLVLPRARPAVPSRGHPRRQPAVRLGRPRGRRHHDRRLVPRPADRRPRRRGGRRAAGGARPVRAGVRQHPGRALGVDGRPGGEGVLRPAPVRRRHARLPDRLRRARRGVVPRGAGVRVRPRARPAAHHPRRRLGRDQRQRHPADARERLHGRGQHLRARRHADRGQLPAHRGVGRLRLGVDGVRAERRPGLPAHLAGTPPRHPGVAVARHQRVVEQRPVHRHADDARRRPLARAPRGARRRRHRHQLLLARRAGRRLGDPRRRTGARPRRPRPAEPGQEGRRRADQERRLGRSPSRCSTPTATSPSRPSAATCTPSSSTATS